jgi:predicted ArsR family transcriptional regulator
MGVQEVADRTGSHVNTARFHLDGLVEAGLAERMREARTTPGRPRTVYRPVGAAGAAGRRSYRLLAEILTSLVAGTAAEPGEAAAEAGRAWGRYLTQRPAPFQRLDADQAIQRLASTLEEIGFAPEITGSGRRRQIRLRRCPFREIAEDHPGVVCPVHLGLMQGALTEMRAPVTAERLEPFVEPSLCLAHLTIGASRTGDDGTQEAVSPLA